MTQNLVFIAANILRNILLILVFAFIFVRRGRGESPDNTYLCAVLACSSLLASLFSIATVSTAFTDLPEYIRLLGRFQPIDIIAVNGSSHDAQNVVAYLISLENSPFGWFAILTYVDQEILRLDEQTLLFVSFCFTLILVVASLVLSKALSSSQKFLVFAGMLLSSIFTYNCVSMLRQGLCTTLLICCFLLVARPANMLIVNKTISFNFHVFLTFFCFLALPLVHGTGLIYLLLILATLAIFILSLRILPHSLSPIRMQRLLICNTFNGLIVSLSASFFSTFLILAFSFFLYPFMRDSGVVAGAMSTAGELGSGYAAYSWNTNALLFPIGPSFLLASSILYCYQLSCFIANPHFRAFLFGLPSRTCASFVLAYLFSVSSTLFMLASFALYPASLLSLRLGSQGALLLLISLIVIYTTSISKDSLNGYLGCRLCTGKGLTNIAPSSSFAPLLYCLYSGFFVF